MQSAIYIGTLRHRRFRPKKHFFTYPLFMPYLDIDKLPELMAASLFTSYNRGNWASFREEDHFGDPSQSLRERLAADASSHGLHLPDGQIFLLTHLRYFGYNFNPVSFFYCYNRDEELRMILAEVNNTFAETHNYWLAHENSSAPKELAVKHFHHPKQFHVSPFMEMNSAYDWTITQPSERLLIQQTETDSEGVIFDATLNLNRREWCSKEIRNALIAFPWMTAKVIAAIYWQAMRLYLRGVPVVSHPGEGKFTPVAKRQFGASWSSK